MQGVTGSLKMIADEKYLEEVNSAQHGHHYGSLHLDMFNQFAENVSILFSIHVQDLDSPLGNGRPSIYSPLVSAKCKG
jgi:hypothetical protein